jgi:hypothetical protein
MPSDLQHVSDCAHEATAELCHQCCNSTHWNIAFEERNCDRHCGGFLGGGFFLDGIGKRQLNFPTIGGTFYVLVEVFSYLRQLKGLWMN